MSELFSKEIENHLRGIKSINVGFYHTGPVELLESKVQPLSKKKKKGNQANLSDRADICGAKAACTFSEVIGR